MEGGLKQISDVDCSRWLEIKGEGNAVERCRFSEKDPPVGESGVLITVDFSDLDRRGRNTKILRNKFLSYSEEEGHLGNGFETIRVGTSAYQNLSGNVLIQGNYFYRMNAEAEVISVKTSFNIIEWNAFEEVGGAVTFRHGKNNVLKDNVFIGNLAEDTRGVRIFDENHFASNNWFSNLQKGAILVNAGDGNETSGHVRAGNITIQGNTIEECKEGLDLDSGYTIPPVQPIVLAGNRMSNPVDPMIQFAQKAAASIFDFSDVRL